MRSEWGGNALAKLGVSIAGKKISRLRELFLLLLEFRVDIKRTQCVHTQMPMQNYERKC